MVSLSKASSHLDITKLDWITTEKYHRLQLGSCSIMYHVRHLPWLPDPTIKTYNCNCQHNTIRWMWSPILSSTGYKLQHYIRYILNSWGLGNHFKWYIWTPKRIWNHHHSISRIHINVTVWKPNTGSCGNVWRRSDARSRVLYVGVWEIHLRVYILI